MPPTFETSSPFERDCKALTPEQLRRFKLAVADLVDDFKMGRTPRPGLRIKGFRGAEGVFEMTFAPDGRATFQYGTQVRPGEVHIVWRRVGTHEIFNRP